MNNPKTKFFLGTEGVSDNQSTKQSETNLKREFNFTKNLNMTRKKKIKI